MVYIILLLLVIYLILVSKKKHVMKGGGDVVDTSVIINPDYLNSGDGLTYEQNVINKQREENRYLREKIHSLVDRLDDVLSYGNSYNDVFYRRKLNNENYMVNPHISSTDQNYLNLEDDDFSGKTLSTIKFLSQTRNSKYFDNDIHFPSELCGNFCSTSDPNALFHENIDLVRPLRTDDKGGVTIDGRDDRPILADGTIRKTK